MEKTQTTAIGKKTHWIEFTGDRSVKVAEGQNILEASLAAGIPHYHACGGNGECTTCRVFVQGGREHLSPLSEKEKAMKDSIPFPAGVRLACQTFVTGSPVSVHRIIRDETDIQLYIDEEPGADVMQTGHERELVLLFLDIRNFTPFLESYPAFDVIHLMRRLFSLFRKAIEGHEGRIIETAGDGLYSVFGFNTELDQASNQAYGAAHNILDELETFNLNYCDKYFLHRFEVGIGLHAGKVIVGNIGIGVNNNLTVMGLPVNVASRIQTATRTYNNSLVVSDAVYHLLSPRPVARHVEARLKGLRDDYRLYLCGQPFGG